MNRLRSMWFGARDQEGASLVEFALVAPVLLLVLVGILDLGRAVNAYVTVSNAAREGSHYAILHPTAAPSAIASAVRARVVPLDETQVAVTTSYYNGSAFSSWPPASPYPTPLPVRVSVCYPWSAATFIGRFFPAVSPAPCGATGNDAYFQATSTTDVDR
jgi:Flp pilus assembly pilin Flp